MNNEIKQQFFNEFNSLNDSVKSGKTSEGVLFELTKDFYVATGGRLSQYNSPVPVGVAIVRAVKGGNFGFVGARRAIAPFVGEVDFPGGFAEEGETTFDAARRELAEETGITLDDKDWTYAGERVTPGNQLLVFYTYNNVVPWEAVVKAFAELGDKSETEDVVFVDEVTSLCFPLHEDMKKQEFEKWRSSTR